MPTWEAPLASEGVGPTAQPPIYWTATARGRAARPRRRWSAPRSSAAPAADERLHAHQARADRRPSALPARPLAAPHAAARRPAREAHVLPHALLPRALLRRAARLGGESTYTLHCQHALVDDAAGALQHAAVARALLLDPVAPAALRPRAPVLRLGTRRAAQGAGRGAAQGAANRLDTKAAAEGGEDQGSRRGRGCGAASPRNVRKS